MSGIWRKYSNAERVLTDLLTNVYTGRETEGCALSPNDRQRNLSTGRLG